MKRIGLNEGWTFRREIPGMMPGAAAPGETVSLPHDFMIGEETREDALSGQEGAYYPGSVGSYEKRIFVPAEDAGKAYVLEIDGSFGITQVYCEGSLVTCHHYGYSPFHADLTPFLVPGKENRILITVDNRMQPNSRWYSGAGLYRHVSLLTGDHAVLVPWGTQIVTDHVFGDTAALAATVTVQNRTEKELECWAKISLLADLTPADHAGTGRERISRDSGAFGICKLHIPAGEAGTGRAKITVPGAKLWSPEHPDLYEAKITLTDCFPGEGVTKDSILDVEDGILTGIRVITIDDVNGFVINGEPMKLKGGCLHHDNGILGAASFYDSEYRRVKLLKDNGFNAVRFSHNPMSEEELEACDRLGMLVIDEFFDVWRMGKRDLDYSVFFASDWRQDMKDAMERDRNHPSIFAWSIGNEITERGRISEGWKTASLISDACREIDPSRPVMGSLPSFFSGLSDADRGMFWKTMMEEVKAGKSLVNIDNAFGRRIWSGYTEDFSAKFDIVGYNYLNYHYAEAPERFPHRVIIGTESKPMELFDYWNDVERYPFVIGDFVWTAMDYLGETGIGKVVHCRKEDAAAMGRALYQSPFPYRTAGAGDFDLCGFARPRLAYRRIVWGSKETFLAAQNPDWYDLAELRGNYGWPEAGHAYTFPGREHAPMRAVVYSAADEVELIQNGKSLGRKPAGRAQRYTAEFTLAYEPGTLLAVSYTGDQEVSRDEIRTAGEPSQLVLSPDKTSIAADGQSLVFARGYFADADKNLVPGVETKVLGRALGAVTLQALGTGRMKTRENYTAGETLSLDGSFLVIARGDTREGAGKLLVEAPELGLSASCDIAVRG